MVHTFRERRDLSMFGEDRFNGYSSEEEKEEENNDDDGGGGNEEVLPEDVL